MASQVPSVDHDMRQGGNLADVSFPGIAQPARQSPVAGKGVLARRPMPRAGIGVSEPHWLGDPTRYLYAVLHRAAVPGARLGVLLVPPLFHEQPRSRRLLTEVASGLAAMGLPSMCFDFFGTADSAGNSDQLDFASMCVDLDLAAQALRSEAGVERVAVIAWRGAALPVARWIGGGGSGGDDQALVVLWEPVVDGAQWLHELVRADAAERCSPARYRLGRPLATCGHDAQLMGVAVSRQLRSDIAGARLTVVGGRADVGGLAGTAALAGVGALADAEALRGSRCWAVLRSPSPPLALTLERVFNVPAAAPTFDGGTRMDAGLFVTPQLKHLADQLGRALLEAG